MRNFKWIKNATILGLSFFLAILLVKPIGVSTQFSVLSGKVHSLVDSEVITSDQERSSGYQSTNSYYDKSEGKLAKNIANPINYDFVFVLAIPLGAILATRWRRKKSSEDQSVVNSDACKIEKVNKHIYLKSFVGGFLLLYGARLADGCTSGHMMSGMSQGAVSGYVFAAAVFVVAIPTAIYLQTKKGGK